MEERGDDDKGKERDSSNMRGSGEKESKGK